MCLNFIQRCLGHLPCVPSLCLRIARTTKPPNVRNRSRWTCVVLLRHGQREDYVALAQGNGEKWVAQSERPWDPPLSDSGRLQAGAASRRLREELSTNDLPQPTCIFTSPLIRCVETANALADEFAMDTILVEEGLMETICEAWMRQWAVPGANSKWGGPLGAAMPQPKVYGADLEGPPCAVENGLRSEAICGVSSLLRTTAELRALGPPSHKVDPGHHSHVLAREFPFRWGAFETKHDLVNRVIATVRARTAEHPGETVVFVSHGGPTTYAFESLTGTHVPPGSGGMTALFLLRRPTSAGSEEPWEAIIANDASHAEEFQDGVKTLI